MPLLAVFLLCACQGSLTAHGEVTGDAGMVHDGMDGGAADDGAPGHHHDSGPGHDDSGPGRTGDAGSDAGAPDAGPPVIREDHPRLYVTPAQLEGLRAIAASDEDVSSIASYVDRRLANEEDTEAALRSSYPQRVVMPAVLAAALLRESRYVSAAKDYLATLASLDPDLAWDTGTRYRLLAMAMGYDWLHGDLSDDERRSLRDGIHAHVERVRPYVDEPNFVSGHSRLGNVAVLAAVLAVHGEDPRLDSIRDQVIANWTDGYNPVLRYVGRGGGHHMGWTYGSSYSSVDPYLMWRSATGRSWLPGFEHDAAYFYLYAANASLQVPAFGDCWATDVGASAVDRIAAAAGVAGNAHAEAFYREVGDPWAPFRLVRVLTKTGAPAPEPYADLPLMRAFPGAGFVVSRDRWDRAEATTVIFKSTPFYSYNHHHRDQNSFVVDYRGPLLLDAGHYDSYGTDHFRNFYTRSVAHNTLLVHWADEPMRSSHAIDGGQRVPTSWADEPRTVDDLTGPSALEGLQVHAGGDACTWIRGEASSAYHPEKLDTYIRDLLVIRSPSGRAHPAILVVDRVRLPEARPAEVVWHLSQDVTLGASRVLASNPGGGHVRLDFLRPSDPRIESFSGARRWEVGGTSHPPTRERGGVSPYWGRVEVSSRAVARNLTFSTLVTVDGHPLTDERLAAPADVGGTGWVGARSEGTLFALATGDVSRLELPAGDPLVDACVAGLPAHASVEVVVGGHAPVTIHADAQGLARYEE